MPRHVAALEFREFILIPVPLPKFQPMPLGHAREPFSHPDWIFEIKWDGFGSLVQIEHSECRLTSRNGNDFKSFPTLNESLPAGLRARSTRFATGIIRSGLGVRIV